MRLENSPSWGPSWRSQRGIVLHIPGRSIVLSICAISVLAFLSACKPGSGPDDLKVFSLDFDDVVPLTPAEVRGVIEASVNAVGVSEMVVAVTDRLGRPLGVYRKDVNAPAPIRDIDNIAVSLARTTSFFSNSQAPLSSRTVQYLSTFHFPPRFEAPFISSVCPSSDIADCPDTAIPPQQTTAGVKGTPQGPLWQIDATNRGAPVAGQNAEGNGDLTTPPTDFNATKAYPRSLNLDGTFPSAGIVLLPGAIPLFKGGRLVGGVSTYIERGNGPEIDAMEFASFAGAQALGFNFPVDPSGAIFLVGLLLPYIENPTIPNGYVPDPGAFGAIGDFAAGFEPETIGGGLVDPFGSDPSDPTEYLIGPRASPENAPIRLTQAEVTRIITQCVETADINKAAIRLPLGSSSKVIMTVVDREGLILAHYRMEDTLTDAIDVVPAKARTVVYYSRPEGPAPEDQIPGLPLGLATTTTALGFLSQPFFPPGIDDSGQTGPLFNLALINKRPVQATRWGREPEPPPVGLEGRRNGLIFFPGAVPLYKDGRLVGGLGVSGDGVENNDFIAAGGAVGFEPPANLKISGFKYRGVEIPYLKFPQNPGPSD